MKTLLLYITVIAGILVGGEVSSANAFPGPEGILSVRNDAHQQQDPKLPKVITAHVTRSIENETVTVVADFPDDVPGVKVSMYNILGKVIDIQTFGPTAQGEAAFQFQTKGLPNGPYLIVLEAGAQRITNKVMLAR